MARPRSEYAGAAATANPTASATLFGPADLEEIAYSPPTPSSVLAPATTGAHHGHATALALTTALANSPASAAPSSVQLRQLNRPSHFIHSTWTTRGHTGDVRVRAHDPRRCGVCPLRAAPPQQLPGGPRLHLGRLGRIGQCAPVRGLPPVPGLHHGTPRGSIPGGILRRPPGRAGA